MSRLGEEAPHPAPFAGAAEAPEVSEAFSQVAEASAEVAEADGDGGGGCGGGGGGGGRGGGLISAEGAGGVGCVCAGVATLPKGGGGVVGLVTLDMMSGEYPHKRDQYRS